ncbi:hypothetical protein PS2_034655 [Malus domestica]
MESQTIRSLWVLREVSKTRTAVLFLSLSLPHSVPPAWQMQQQPLDAPFFPSLFMANDSKDELKGNSPKTPTLSDAEITPNRHHAPPPALLHCSNNRSPLLP